MGEKKITGFLNLEEACRFLGNMPANTLREKVKFGTVRAYNTGRHLVFDPADLTAFVKRRPAGRKKDNEA